VRKCLRITDLLCYSASMETVVSTWCSRCKITGVPFVKYSSSVRNGVKYTYHQCRPCNTARLYKYRQTKEGKEKVRLLAGLSRVKHPQRHYARSKINNAIKMGRLKRKNCEECGVENAHAHHSDYSKPFLVDWLCRTCHSDLHRLLV
jgi:hypothetical protein